MGIFKDFGPNGDFCPKNSGHTDATKQLSKIRLAYELGAVLHEDILAEKQISSKKAHIFFVQRVVQRSQIESQLNGAAG